MKNIRLVGRLKLERLKKANEGITFHFGSVPEQETMERFTAIVAVGKVENGEVSTIQIIFIDKWDGNGIEGYIANEDKEPGELIP